MIRFYEILMLFIVLMASFEEFIGEVLEEINLLRTRPGQFAERMEPWEKNFRDNNARMRKGAVPVMTKEGVSALLETIQAIRTLRPMSPLEMNEGLRRTAQMHCNDTGPLGIVGHIGSRETTLPDRLGDFGDWKDCIGETIDYGSVSAFESVCALIIDDGLPSRPHRNIVLNPRFKKVGIGAGKHNQFNTMACCVFAGDFIERPNMPVISIPKGKVESVVELKDWMEDAVKLTCEIRTEEQCGKIIKRIKKYWEMADGTTEVVEEVIRL
jgi:uncharacterized protein YkwD